MGKEELTYRDRAELVQRGIELLDEAKERLAELEWIVARVGQNVKRKPDADGTTLAGKLEEYLLRRAEALRDGAALVGVGAEKFRSETLDKLAQGEEGVLHYLRMIHLDGSATGLKGRYYSKMEADAARW